MKLQLKDDLCDTLPAGKAFDIQYKLFSDFVLTWAFDETVLQQSTCNEFSQGQGSCQ
jgi:hypothetical protein